MTATAQNTTGIINTTKSIHNTTFPGDTIVHRGIALVMIVSMVIVQTIEDQHAMGTSKTVKFRAMKTA